MIQVKKSFYSSLDRGIPPSGDLSVKPQQAQGYCAGLPPSGRLFIALVLRACARCNSRSNFGTKNLLFGFLVNYLLRKLHRAILWNAGQGKSSASETGTTVPNRAPTNYQPARRGRWCLSPLAPALAAIFMLAGVAPQDGNSGQFGRATRGGQLAGQLGRGQLAGNSARATRAGQLGTVHSIPISESGAWRESLPIRCPEFLESWCQGYLIT